MSFECQLGLHYDFTHEQYLQVLEHYTEDELVFMFNNNREQLTLVLLREGIHDSTFCMEVQL